MLTENDFKLLEKEAIKLYGDLEFEIIQEIAERIANVGYANTVVYNNAVILQEMGVLYEDIINMVAKYNETTISQIQDIFETAGIKSLKRDDSIYKLAGLSPKGLSETMIQLLEATARKTHNNLSNLTMTTANTSQIQFLNAMNKAYMEVSTGVKSYSQSILDTIKEVSKSGAYVEYPSGKHRSIESAVRMNILTSVNQTSGKLQELRAEEMGWDLVEVSAHGGARPEHDDWQGKVYSLKGLTKGYKTLEEGCDYGRVTGLCGVNCRHTFFPYYKGSTKTYTNKELNKLKNETVTYNGKKMSVYDATQIQRKMERQIRQDKKDIAGLQGVLTSNEKDSKLIEETKLALTNTKNKLSQHNSLLNDFIEQTGFRKDNSRLVVGNVIKNKEVKELKYLDITDKLKNQKNYYKIVEQQFFVDNNGNKYRVDGKRVVLRPNMREKEVAEILGEIYGGKVRMIPRVSYPLGIKTPDYMIREEKFDLKEITGGGKYVIEGNLRKKQKQSNNFIIDITNAKLDVNEAEKQIVSIYNSKRYRWIDKILVIKEKELIRAYQRK